MSILRKVPKIEQVLDNMSLESLKRLESLINSGNGATETYTLFGGENKLNYENKELGVWYCNIELERNKSVETGFLIWESQTKALFISFDITQCLKEYEIDLTNYSYTKINEKLSIEEFRRVLEDNINKEVVHIDTSGNVEIGKNLVVGGKVILNGKEDLVDTSGNELISSGGGDIWLDLKPYLSYGDEGAMSISQEGYDLIYNNFNAGVENPINKYVGILLNGNKFIFNGLINSDIPDKNAFNFILNYTIDGVKCYMEISIYNDKSIGVIDEMYSTITLPQTAPSSQVIPSITTSNEQQNLTIGNGLVIENGELKTKELEMVVSITATLDDLKNAVNSVSYISYSESNKEEIISFITNQKGIMKLTITTPVGNLYMTLRPSVWGYDGSPVYDFEGSLILEKDLSAIGGSVVNQIIVRAICWDNTEPVHFRPTIIPIRK